MKAEMYQVDAYVNRGVNGKVAAVCLHHAMLSESMDYALQQPKSACTARRPEPARFNHHSQRNSYQPKSLFAQPSRMLWMLLLLNLCWFASNARAQDLVTIETNLGAMTFELYAEDAPKTVANFQRLAGKGWYDGKRFYRVVKGHVIQAGSLDNNDEPTLVAEFNSRPHIKGTLGLARDEDPNSGSTEFYICDAARPHLDGRYTVFGQLIEGEAVLDAIANVDVIEKYYDDAKKIAFHEPKTAVVITAIRLH
ncbi:peptidylprolyl isomerase [Shewanella sp. JM162201]|uniref:Peptidyl-prolyl cis-trans isomerase n=1 Tax=Shewanella jiangmenensis TaxID=2837387 RepID=A0ABS5UZC0_9GAMM|nr:peptidylprolyl isomerase [Shewanella jiangmenensis]MBT1443532.1 peptidylprolyl isomerase [Shewanella jiangmenensis]